MAREDKLKALEAAILQIEKQYGKGSVMKLGDTSSAMKVETIPTGSISLDIALGQGGLPKGRIIEIYGPESSGKTTVALHAVSEVQKRGGIAGFIDAEHALDPVYAKNIGVDIDNLYISQPDNGEQALEIAETMVRSNAVDIVIVDSVAALVPKAEIDGEMGDSHVGLQARLMSQALRKLTAVISRSNCIVIFINQLREKVGVMFGSPETTTGGRALKFYSSVRLDVRRIESLKQQGEVIGNRTRIKVVKNKIAPPFKEAEFDIMFGKGISKEGDVLDMASDLNIINKSGAWYAYNGEKIGQGRENAKQYLAANKELFEEVEKQVRAHYNLDGDSSEEDDDKSKNTGDDSKTETSQGKNSKQLMIVIDITECTKTKVKVRLDNREDFQLYKREIVKYGIEVDKELNNYDVILRKTLIPRAKKRTMHLIGQMDRTKSDIIKKLKQNGYPDAAIEEALAYVESYNYVNDLRYAYMYVRTYRDSRSRNRIMQDMYRKGLDTDTINSALESEYTTDEADLIRRHIDKRGYTSSSASNRDRDKMYRYLLGKGFDLDTIRSVIE